MILSKLALTLTEDDINNGLSAAFAKMAETHGEMLKKVKDPKVTLKDGLLIFKCKAAMGFMPLPIEAQLRLAPAQDGAALDITLAKLSMAMMGGEAGASAAMGQLASAVAGKPGLSVNGNTLTVAISELAKLRGIGLSGSLKDIAILNGTIALDFS
ncbi:MAG: hypothetical protein J6V91_01085 [Kiritimatiellae bacterium]|jgi:hypothetical protein|nr:hypothetical protein [Kiritimatiellia bacterium]